MLNVVTNICPGPVTLLISVPLYVLITLNFDVFKLINLLATNEGQLLFFFFFLLDIYYQEKEQTPSSRKILLPAW